MRTGGPNTGRQSGTDREESIAVCYGDSDSPFYIKAQMQLEKDEMLGQDLLDFARAYFMARVHGKDVVAPKRSKAYDMGWERGEDDYNVYDEPSACPHNISEDSSL